MSRRVPPPVEAPAFASILTSQDTYLNSVTPLSVVGSGGGGSNYPADANFSTIAVFPTQGGVVFAVDPTRTYQKGADFTLEINGLTLYLPKIIFNRENGGSGYITSLYDNTDTIIIQSTLTTSALNVSSINGAIPGTGGTVPPNLALSTLNVSSMITTSSITSWNFVSPEEPGTYIKFSEGSLIDLHANGGDISLTGLGCYVNCPLVTSTITVSSINGAIPGTGGSYPADANFSTINVASVINAASVHAGTLTDVSFIYGLPVGGTALIIDNTAYGGGHINLNIGAVGAFGVYANSPYFSTNLINVSSIQSRELSTFTLNTSSISGVPVFTLAQYQALSTLAA